MSNLVGGGNTQRRGDRALRVVAVTLGVVGVALFTLGVVYAYRNTRLVGAEVDWTNVAWGSWTMAVVVVGVVITVVRPRLFVGWGLLLIGVSIDAVAFGEAYGGWARLSGQVQPLSGLAVWLGLIARGVFPMMAPLVVTRLPSGRPDRRIARLTSRVSWALGVALVGWWAFGNDELTIYTLSNLDVVLPRLPNPLALLHPSRAVTTMITTTLTIGLLACWFVAVVLVVRRRRRASAVERAQLRWLAYGNLAIPAVAVITLMVQVAAPSFENIVSSVVFPVIGFGAVPVSIAISVLKFRLFEIDRLVSRTLSFAIVALVLGGLYAMLATLPSLVIGGSGDTPSWLVAASTLAAAALFSPLRRRVHRVVDRRFNRSRYDAEQVVERFSSQVREFTDVGAIASGLTGAVRGALQPAGVALWVRGMP